MSFGDWIKKKWRDFVEVPASNIWHHVIVGDKESITDRYQKKQTEWYKAELTKINEKYNLGISSDTIQTQANWYGEDKRDEEFDDVQGGIGYNSNLDIKQNLTQNFLNFGLSTAKNFMNSISHEKLNELNNINRQIIIEKSKAAEKAEGLTQILMKDPFSIFANGYLYKQGAAGSKSYNPLTPYEPYKYITGDIVNNEFDDILMGRSHLKLAGNRDYFSNVWEEPLWNLPDKNRMNRLIMAYIYTREKRFNIGFEEVNKLGWINRDGVHSLIGEKEHQFEKLTKSLPNRFDISKYSGF